MSQRASIVVAERADRGADDGRRDLGTSSSRSSRAGKFMQSTKMSSKSGWAASETCSMRRGDRLGAGALGLGEQAELGAQRGGVADVADPRSGSGRG